MARNKFDYIQVGLASAEKIREWSYGEVKKSETINYRTLKPERDGLFCERIFGPTRDWECTCGKYKRVRYKGIVCERCGVEVTKASVRRERMGHIELASPVAHIWYFKGTPNRMSLLLDLMPKQLEEIIYFISYVVVDPMESNLSLKQILSDREYRMYYEQYGEGFKALMGAEAIKALLEKMDLDLASKTIREELETAQGQKRTRLIRRLEVVESFRKSNNRPHWMILDALPVIPPELRPMVELDGGRFATSDLNDLYRRVIDRNNRLHRFENSAPSIIVQNEKRMLQESVDALIDNGRRGRAVTGPGNRPLKSLSHMLKGKQGRFRQNLLGKRVDYSGRSVIVVGPTLEMHQCGLPKDMALELFKPFVIAELTKNGYAQNIKVAKRLIESRDKIVYSILEGVVSGHPVLLNRAPTLHRLGIQAFEPRLVEGKAIRLHPLVTTAFNADFDGDQMAVHVPLSQEAQAEARILMLAANNILNPKDGNPVVTPSQDMVLGNYYLTMESDGDGSGHAFSSYEEALVAYQTGQLSLHARIVVPVSSLSKESFTEQQRGELLITTIGKLVFNDIFPKTMPFINDESDVDAEEVPDKHFVARGENYKVLITDRDLLKPFKKGTLEKIIARVFREYRTTKTAEMLDKMKDLGFRYSTAAGITVSFDDVVTITDEKKIILDIAQKQVDVIWQYFNRGLMTDAERHVRVCRVWEEAKDEITDKLILELETNHKDNPILMMQESGARGNKSNFAQLAGMRGLMADPRGETIEMPIRSSFRDGLTVLEYFMSTHGARKGLTDTALKTADSGYLTRRLVDVAQDIIVRHEDCHTDKGVKVMAMLEKGKEIVPFLSRIVGRYSAKSILHPETKEIIVGVGEMITPKLAEEVVASGLENIIIRSVLTCTAGSGICQKCYGRSLSTGELVEIGETVGIMAAQSIGEPGTQLTMRTFHTGGVAGGDITQGLPRIQEIFEARNPKGKAVLSEIDGVIKVIETIKDKTELTIESEFEQRNYQLPFGSRLIVTLNQEVHAGEQLTEGVIDPKELLILSGIEALRNYMILEVQKVYRLQGINIEDKHIEVIIRQMLQKVRIVESGDADLLPGILVDLNEYTAENNKVLGEGRRPAVAHGVLLGITKSSIETSSFLSAASFQETTRVLTDAAVRGRRDNLVGLKENVIIGQLIPAGTGFTKYQDIIVPEVIVTNDAEEDEIVEFTEVIAESTEEGGNRLEDFMNEMKKTMENSDEALSIDEGFEL
ncbi:DNA-directed RNA polymerase subunit beta' [Erysipelotrichaceae bacterium]|nr:DNA-directed RNA polymerase subunit beta' [Erysipelotrichaceae bacterium]